MKIEIKKIVLDYFKLSAKEVFYKGKGSRKRELVYARQIIAYFLGRYTKLSLAKIGEEIGGYDHATILFAEKQINDLYDVDKDVRNDIEKIKIMINNKKENILTAIEILKEYEKWETELMLSETWDGGFERPLPKLTEELFNRLLAIQILRNKILHEWK